MSSLIKAVVLNFLVLMPSSLGENQTVSTVEMISENSTHNDEILPNPPVPDDRTIGDMFRLASYEIVELSPLAWIMILIPLITTFVFCVLIVYMCCRKTRPQAQCRYEPKNLAEANAKEVSPTLTHSVPSHIVVKAPAGQPAPIPLMGLVNQPNGQGLKLMPKNHYYQPSTNYN